MHLQLDLLDKVRATTKQRMTHHFKVRDLVLRKMTTATWNPSQGKLGPNP